MGFLEVAAAIASAGYTGYKLWRIIKEMLDAKKMTKWQMVSRVVSAAVTSVYEDFVREEKGDGAKKLSDKAKSKARDMAYDKVLQGLRDHNLGVSDLTHDEIIDMIEESVAVKKMRIGGLNNA